MSRNGLKERQGANKHELHTIPAPASRNRLDHRTPRLLLAMGHGNGQVRSFQRMNYKTTEPEVSIPEKNSPYPTTGKSNKHFPQAMLSPHSWVWKETAPARRKPPTSTRHNRETDFSSCFSPFKGSLFGKLCMSIAKKMAENKGALKKIQNFQDFKKFRNNVYLLALYRPKIHAILLFIQPCLQERS